MKRSLFSLVATAILCHSVTALPHGGHGGLHMGFVETAANDVGNTVQGLSGGLLKARQADPQTSLQLDPSIIGPNLAKDGLAGATEAGQAASLTSINNFINFCAGKTIMNGLQGPNGQQLCNPVPMGDIPSNSTMINCKFQSPANFGTLKTNTSFDIVMAVSNFQTGDFVNPNTNYFAAPQQLNPQGQIIGHSHFVVEPITSLQDTTPTDPTKFAYFKGVNEAAVDGKLTVTLTEGLPAGTYRIASINTAGNHQPALVPVAQHGSLDDMIYITVTDDGQADNATVAANAADNAAASATDSAAASSSIDSAAASSSIAVSAAAVSSAASTTDAASSIDSAAVSSSIAVSAAAAASSAASTTDAASSIDSAAVSFSVADSTAAVSSAASTTDAAAATDVSVAASAVAPIATAAARGTGFGGRGRF